MDGGRSFMGLKQEQGHEKTVSDTEMIFKLGKVYYYNCDFAKAEHYLMLAKGISLQASPPNIEIIIKINNILMRISAERLDLEKHSAYQEETYQFLNKTKAKTFFSKYYYQVGLLDYYKTKYESAKTNFEKAYDCAIKQGNAPDQAHALYGIASYYFEKNDVQKTLEILQTAQKLAENITNKDLLISIYIFKGLLHTSRSAFKKGFAAFESAKNIIRKHKNWYMNYIIMYHMALATKKHGSHHKARELFEYLFGQIHDSELNQLKKKTQIEIDELSSNKYDLTIDVLKRTVIERQKGAIPFKNCFLLVDILLLFSKSQGKVFTKEDLSNTVWNEDYNPLVHDNKIYYNINRLRNLIESKNSKTKYIMTSKEGYFLNPNVTIKIKESP